MDISNRQVLLVGAACFALGTGGYFVLAARSTPATKAEADVAPPRLRENRIAAPRPTAVRPQPTQRQDPVVRERERPVDQITEKRERERRGPRVQRDKEQKPAC
jgi:hypothetical protein